MVTICLGTSVLRRVQSHSVIEYPDTLYNGYLEVQLENTEPPPALRDGECCTARLQLPTQFWLFPYWTVRVESEPLYGYCRIQGYTHGGIRVEGAGPPKDELDRYLRLFDDLVACKDFDKNFIRIARLLRNGGVPQAKHYLEWNRKKRLATEGLNRSGNLIYSTLYGESA